MSKQSRRFPILAAVALLAAALGCGSSITPRVVQTIPLDQATPSSTVEPATVHEVGDVVRIGDIVVAVVGWETSGGSEIVRPGDGMVFVSVDVIFVNAGQSPVTLLPSQQMNLKDSRDQQYALHAGASGLLGRGLPNGEVSPGERVRGQVGFEVAREPGDWVFVLDVEKWRAGKVFVALGKGPTSISVPDSIAGETHQNLSALGTPIEAGELTLEVTRVTRSAGGDFWKPAPGGEFVIVNVALTNSSDAAQHVSSLLQFWLKDSTGQIYDVNLVANMEAPMDLPDGEYAPGETIRGQVGFQVPEGTGGLVFVFDAQVWGFGKVFVDLSG